MSYCAALSCLRMHVHSHTGTQLDCTESWHKTRLLVTRKVYSGQGSRLPLHDRGRNIDSVINCAAVRIPCWKSAEVRPGLHRATASLVARVYRADA